MAVTGMASVNGFSTAHTTKHCMRPAAHAAGRIDRGTHAVRYDGAGVSMLAGRLGGGCRYRRGVGARQAACAGVVRSSDLGRIGRARLRVNLHRLGADTMMDAYRKQLWLARGWFFIACLLCYGLFFGLIIVFPAPMVDSAVATFCWFCMLYWIFKKLLRAARDRDGGVFTTSNTGGTAADSPEQNGVEMAQRAHQLRIARDQFHATRNLRGIVRRE